MLNTKGWEVYRFFDFPVNLMDLLSSPSHINFQTFWWGKTFFSQVYFEEIALCFTLINVLKVLHLFERVALLILLHDIYNCNSQRFVVMASKFMCHFIFQIILCQQFLSILVCTFQLLMSFSSKYQNM